jgi:hypothetical protein
MKKVTLLATIILTLAMCASAQQLVDFTQLPASGSPQPVPNGYDGLRWDAIEFVSAPLYPDANLYIGANGAVNSGRGFFTGNEAMVAFGGGPMCYHDYGATVADGQTDKHICESSISAWNKAVFQVDSAIVSDGWDASGDFITVTAYNNGVQVGSSFQYPLSTTAQKLDFTKNNWGKITELVIHPSPKGSFVIYTLEVN